MSESSIPLLLAVVRETEEIESLRSPLPSRPAVHQREPAELDEAGLVGVQVECELGAALFRRRSRNVQEGLRAAWQELLDAAKAG